MGNQKSLTCSSSNVYQVFEVQGKDPAYGMLNPKQQ